MNGCFLAKLGLGLMKRTGLFIQSCFVVNIVRSILRSSITPFVSFLDVCFTCLLVVEQINMTR